jgi:hypothetical protein
MIGGIDMSLVMPPILSLPMESPGMGVFGYTVPVWRLVFRKQTLSWIGRYVGTEEKASTFRHDMYLDTGASEVYLPLESVKIFVDFFECRFYGPAVACPLGDDAHAAVVFDIGGYHLTDL